MQPSFPESLTSFFTNSYILDSAKLLIMGSLIETGRRLCQWLMKRFKFQYSTTVQFISTDPAYEWIILFLTQEGVWRKSHEFWGSAKSSDRKWGISQSGFKNDENADYVPTYHDPQLFRWRGYWLEIRRDISETQHSMYGGRHGPEQQTICLTVYSLDISVMSALVQDARSRYIAASAPHVIIHMSQTSNPYGGSFPPWTVIKAKPRRPIDSIILDGTVLESIVEDAEEFLETEDWYSDAGIPHRRGYLLFGPPGTGKSSTIYALAGELGLEIYSLSLASSSLDDSSLQTAAAAVPKRSILLLEDIDCAFPSREESEENDEDDLALFGPIYSPYGAHPKVSNVTLSGLLNVIDGIGSEEGKLFIATTNHIDKLDPALLRPGRIDRKIEYSLATQDQAAALFIRFFPASRFAIDAESSPITSVQAVSTSLDEKKSKPKRARVHERYLTSADLISLSKTFASAVPAKEFTTAEIQGYLLSRKTAPGEAATEVGTWVEEEREIKKLKAAREQAKLDKKRAAKAKREAERLQQLAGLRNVDSRSVPPTPIQVATTNDDAVEPATSEVPNPRVNGAKHASEPVVAVVNGTSD